MQSVLITQCLQQDFVKPLRSGEPLPNALHIGHHESRRLVGEDLESGPIARFMAWANSQNGLHKIHIRDWHDPNSPAQANHLKHFGSHCLQNSPGANFIFTRPERDPSPVIDSTTLNDFQGTALKEHLDILAKTIQRIGIIGVWTEAKVLFLAYELSTRYPQIEIAVCSALTASSSRSQHFLALQQLQRVVGMRTIDSVGEFVQFLGGRAPLVPATALNRTLRIQADADIALDDEKDRLLRYLFRDCQSLSLKVLDGGFSGNLVAGVSSIDAHGHEQAPHVVKIGQRDLMARERTAFEQIEMVMGNNAPAIAEYADFNRYGAIKYRYAAMGGGKAQSFQDCYQKGASLETIAAYLDAVFDEQLGRLYRAAVTDKQDLLAYYCFSSHWADSVKHKIQELIGRCPDTGPLRLPGNRTAPNLFAFYHKVLDKLPPIVGDFPFSFVHGDLNGANIIIDDRDNVWLIDFFHTHRGHVLKDFAKLENDLLYIYTPIESKQELTIAYSFTDFLLALGDPLDELPPLVPTLRGTQFERAYHTLAHIRRLASSHLDNTYESARLQWLLPQLRYAVHTIGFGEPNKLQRIWALYSAARIAAELAPELAEEHEGEA